MPNEVKVVMCSISLLRDKAYLLVSTFLNVNQWLEEAAPNEYLGKCLHVVVKLSKID